MSLKWVAALAVTLVVFGCSKDDGTAYDAPTQPSTLPLLSSWQASTKADNAQDEQASADTVALDHSKAFYMTALTTDDRKLWSSSDAQVSYAEGIGWHSG